MTFEINIEAEDVVKQANKFANLRKIIDKHTFPAMQKSVNLMLAGWRDVAAVDTGFYRDGLKSGVQNVGGTSILQGFVATNARSRRGFPYPSALERSPKFHYRSTRRRGQQTAGQVSRMFLGLQPTLNKLFAEAQEKIIKDLQVK